MPHSAEVAFALFSNIADKENGRPVREAAGLHHRCGREQGSNAGSIVGDAGAYELLPLATDFERRARGENGIDVGTEGDERTLIRSAGTDAGYVSGLVDFDLLKAEIAKARFQPLGAPRLPKGRGRHARDLHLPQAQLVFLRTEPGESIMDAMALSNLCDRLQRHGRIADGPAALHRRHRKKILQDWGLPQCTQTRRVHRIAADIRNLIGLEIHGLWTRIASLVCSRSLIVLARHLTSIVLCACIVPSAAGLTPAAPPNLYQDCGTPPPSYLDEAGFGVQKLQTWYNSSTGLWNTTNWWNAANSTTVLVNYSKVSGSTDYQPTVENTFNRNSSHGFLNNYYDDEGWWALAWIDAYDWTQDPTYLNMATSIFNDMAGGWDDVCGGGIWWSKARTYKNAIANELFLSVAAHLANRTTDPDLQASYTDWANLEWQWFSQSGMINANNLINDGLRINPDGSCVNNGQTTWTYNQGVILGGLAELSQQNPDPSLPQTAQDIALAAISRLTDANGILHDRCEPNCGGDGVQFKGIFVRNVMALNDAFPSDQYVQFAQTNADSIWHNDQGTDDQGTAYEFGLVWSGPFNPDTHAAASQTSALDAIIAAAEMTPSPVAVSITKLGSWRSVFRSATASPKLGAW